MLGMKPAKRSSQGKNMHLKVKNGLVFDCGDIFESLSKPARDTGLLQTFVWENRLHEGNIKFFADYSHIS